MDTWRQGGTKAMQEFCSEVRFKSALFSSTYGTMTLGRTSLFLVSHVYNMGRGDDRTYRKGLFMQLILTECLLGAR